MPRLFVSNGGSAIGEAIGQYMEAVVQEYIGDFLNPYPCQFVTKIGRNPITGRELKKLLLSDSYGTPYQIDGVITTESMQPLVLIESKYIRYKKHNRDKGSWICQAHTAIRQRFKSIRGSVAILAGSWSKASLLMISNSDVNYFVIPLEFITQLFAEKGVDIAWEESERDRALAAWYRYEALPESEKLDIAHKMVDSIKAPLFETLAALLDDTKPREVRRIVIEIKTSRGEVQRIPFESREEAIDFLKNLDLDDLFDESTFISIFEPVEVDE